MLRFTGDDSVQARGAQDKVIRVGGLAQILYDDFSLLHTRRAALDERITRWVDTLDDARLAAKFTFTNTAGGCVTSVLWQTLSHLFNHQTHHRGQVTTLLTQAGEDVGSTDLLAMFREVREEQG
jgi:uncharacterized damage-inducible protein DinB